MQSLGGILTAGLASTQPAAMEFLGRVLVVFCFNEAVAQGLGLATTGKGLGSLRAHLSMLAVAAAVVAAPRSPRSGRGRPWPHGPSCSAWSRPC